MVTAEHAYLVGGFALMLLVAGWLARTGVLVPLEKAGKYASIDGLRGFAATFVFFHHAHIWLIYRQGGVWEEPASRSFALLGKAGVWVFFMITSFLFVGRLLDARAKGGFDWLRFFVSRFLRIAPLYYFVLAVMVLLVAVYVRPRGGMDTASDMLAYAKWIAFGVTGRPDFAEVDVLPLTAGVTWTLAYEWTFYLALPLCAFALSVRVNKALLAASAAVTLVLLYYNHSFGSFGAFFLGGLVAWLVRAGTLRGFATTRMASALCVGLIVLLVALPKGRPLLDLGLLFVFFWLVAQGCTVFGCFALRSVRYLGQISYSIYLTHGLLLYLFMSMRNGSAPTLHGHWLAACGLGVALVVSASVTYRLFERPFMRRVDWLTERLRRAGAAATPAPR